MNKLFAGTALAALMIASPGFAQENGQVEVLHWWTSGGEAAALDVLRADLETQGIGWQDMPVAGGGGSDAMTVLRARVTGGNAPTAVQMLGFDILDWAREGSLGNLDEIASEQGWDEVVPEALQAFSRYEDHWIAAPVNVHSTNWMWINNDALEAAGGEIPETWEDLIAMLDNFREQGITPIGHGGQDWQDATIFDAVVLSMGTDFYQQTMIDLDLEALRSETMVDVFDRMEILRGYVDDNFSGRDWNLASAMVINGEAGVQFMGDWAKGEFLNAGLEPGVDFQCARYPGTQGAVTFNADQFAMFSVAEEQVPAQLAMASSIMSPEFQVAFNTVKGSAPARTDISDEEFDACGQKAMADLAEASENGTLLGSMAHGHANPAGVKNAMYDVITAHFNGEYTSEEAAEELANAVEFAM
ncbi:ABC transporter substrate-binding protein [Pelagibacterium montanilacus]|uniref:ABC transporter substrate-binding protein n=1 Tax=Pelagibacterium montanilacus TaxID=2185280 RepID=UPI000F8D040D|nr:ABC transporter substrate-binding protein [Pelagibacterium montanilacus]